MMADKIPERGQYKSVEVNDLQRQLRESEARYRSLAAALAQMVWVVDAEGAMERQMEAWHAYTGQYGKRLSHQDLQAMVHPEDQQWVEHAWQSASLSERPYELAYRIQRFDGIYHHFGVRAIPVLGEYGKVREWIFIGTDIDERKREKLEMSQHVESALPDIQERDLARETPALIRERQHLLCACEETRHQVVSSHATTQRLEEFIGVASHELRTPLTAIKVNVQLAMRRLKTAMKQLNVHEAETFDKIKMASDLMERAERQIGVLSNLVSDMVDISRIQSERFASYLRQDECDVRAVVEQVVSEQQKVNPERTIHKELSSDDTLTVIADAGRISQVINSYLRNALKYSAADKEIAISLRRAGACVRLEVRDQGQGLTVEEQQRVWECFYQCPKIRVLSGSGVGLGLGLYISQTVIEHHHGHVGVESIPGQGSTFWFELPLAHRELI
jgi:PAS domain S-box-containing protein